MGHENKNNQDRGNKGNQINIETVQFVIEIPEKVGDNFRDAVEKNGKSMTEVLKTYMQKYIWKQSELQRNRQKSRGNIG